MVGRQRLDRQGGQGTRIKLQQVLLGVGAGHRGVADHRIGQLAAGHRHIAHWVDGRHAAIGELAQLHPVAGVQVVSQHAAVSGRGQEVLVAHQVQADPAGLGARRRCGQGGGLGRGPIEQHMNQLRRSIESRSHGIDFVGVLDRDVARPKAAQRPALNDLGSGGAAFHQGQLGVASGSGGHGKQPIADLAAAVGLHP